jgi:hypothetical protein
VSIKSEAVVVGACMGKKVRNMLGHNGSAPSWKNKEQGRMKKTFAWIEGLVEKCQLQL